MSTLLLARFLIDDADDAQAAKQRPAAIAALAAAETLLPLPPDAAMPLWLGLSLVFGFEGNDWRREGLAARGYVERGPASGADLAEAELRWFAGSK